MFSCAANSTSWHFFRVPSGETRKFHAAHRRQTSLFEPIDPQKFAAKRQVRDSPEGHRRAEKRAHYSTPGITKQPIPSRNIIP